MTYTKRSSVSVGNLPHKKNQVRINSSLTTTSGIHMAVHDSDQIRPKMLARIAKKTGLKPEDL